MRERIAKNSRSGVDYNEGIAIWARPLLWAGGTLLSRPRDSALAIAAGVAAGAIVINSLYLQSGPHPAPIFAFNHSSIASDTPAGAVASVVPRPRPAEVANSEPLSAPAPRAVAPLAPSAPAAIAHRDKDPIAELLGTPPGRVTSTASGRVASVTPAAPVPPAPIPLTASPSAAPQLIAIQRRLAEYGYGPVLANGNDGPDTRAAIERFERRHGLPVTGKVSDRLVREMTSMIGKPL